MVSPIPSLSNPQILNSCSMKNQETSLGMRLINDGMGNRVITVVSFPGLSPRLLSLAAFHTASDKSLGDKPGDEAIITVLTTCTCICTIDVLCRLSSKASTCQ